MVRDAAGTAGARSLKPLFLDVSHQGSVDAAAARVRSELEAKGMELVGIVNNAGVPGKSTAPAGVWAYASVAERTFAVNVIGVLRATEAFLPMLQRGGGGRIINVGSLAGRAHRANDLAYVASKHALEGATDTMRVELQPSGTSVSLLQPGFVQSGMCAHTECQGLMPATTTSPAIEHALLSPYPRTRYPVSSVYGMPAWLVVLLAGLPDRLKDLILGVFE